MAVLLETSKGDLVVDLYTEECPLACKNFLKLCKMKYYNDVLFHNIQKDFIVQTGDPTGTGKGGTSAYGAMYGEQARFFEDEVNPHIKHKRKGMVGMASGGRDCNASQFYITTGNELDSLDAKRTLFGEVTEGMDVLDLINEAFVDDVGRPLQNIRIRHTIVLDDPFEDPPQLAEHIPEKSPEPVVAEGDTRLEDDWVADQDTRSLQEIEESNREKEAHARAVVLEMIGDLPEADSKPPTNMLFVCKLHPVTTEEDLEIIFSRFGTITSCDIIRDFKTGDSLSYAFIGFDTDKASEDAYFKMNNVLIDDRRIKVDFSQSVSHLWRQFKVRGNTADAAAGELANSAVTNAPSSGRSGICSGCYSCGQPGHFARECPGVVKSSPSVDRNTLALKMPPGRAPRYGSGSKTYQLIEEPHAQAHLGGDQQQFGESGNVAGTPPMPASHRSSRDSRSIKAESSDHRHTRPTPRTSPDRSSKSMQGSKEYDSKERSNWYHDGGRDSRCGGGTVGAPYRSAPHAGLHDRRPRGVEQNPRSSSPTRSHRRSLSRERGTHHNRHDAIKRETSRRDRRHREHEDVAAVKKHKQRGRDD